MRPVDFSPLPNEAARQARAARFRDLRVVGLELALVAAALGLTTALDVDIPHRPLAISGCLAAAAGVFALQVLDRRLYARGYVIEDRLRLALLAGMILGGAVTVWLTTRSPVAVGTLLGLAVALAVFMACVSAEPPSTALAVARGGQSRGPSRHHIR